MFTKRLIPLWLLVSALSALFLMGQETWAPPSLKLYGTEVVTYQLWTLEKTSGAGTPIGPTGYDVWGLACNDATGALYGVEGDTPSYLLSIDRKTGQATVIGSIGFNSVRGLAYNKQGGFLYGVTYLNQLVRIDPSTGQGTLIGNPGTAFLDSLEYIPAEGVLYAVMIGDNPDTLYRIDPATGAGTPVGPIGFDNVSGLAYDAATGTLYGAVRASGQLITIDTSTGQGTAVGPPGSLPNTGFNGLCFCN